MFWTIIIGFFVGTVAKLIMPGRDAGGIVLTIILGISGSILASLAGSSLGWYVQGEVYSFVAAVLGAVVVLFFYRLIVLNNELKSN